MNSSLISLAFLGKDGVRTKRCHRIATSLFYPDGLVVLNIFFGRFAVLALVWASVLWAAAIFEP